MTKATFANQENLALSSKLCCPYLAGTDILPRPKLDQLFMDNRDKQLILLTASAGYGKSTLMAQWLHSLTRNKIPTSWLTLDEDDNDPGQLYNCLQMALQNKEEIQVSQPYNSRLQRVKRAHGALLARLFEAESSPQVLFIDEFEVLRNPEAIRLIQFLQQQTPSGKQLVIASRRKPDWSLSKLKLKGSILELRDLELRFDTQEADAIRTLKAAGDLNEALTQRLIEKTEGWIAGMRLALICFAGKQDPERWVEMINGEMGEVANFLTEEFYQHLPTEQQQFLLKISIPNRVCAPLCEALTNAPEAQKHLDCLSKKGMFLQPLDEQQHWFRIHGLVREFLLKRLRQEQPKQVPLLQHTSAQWLASQGDVLEAIHLSIDSGQVQFASQLLESAAASLVQQGRQHTLILLADQLPESIIDQNPGLMIELCMSYMFIHDLKRADRKLVQLQLLAKTIPDISVLNTQLLAIEPLLLIYKDQALPAMTLALSNLSKLGDEDHFQQGALSNLIAYVKLGLGEFEEAKHYQLQARAAHLKSKSIFGLAISDLFGALSEHIRGNLDIAKVRYANIGEGTDYLSDKELGVARAVACCNEAELLYELNQLEEADTLLDRYFPFAVDNVPPEFVVIGYIIRARIAFAQGHYESAYSRLDEGEVTAASWPLPRLVNTIRWERVRFALLRGKLESATVFATKIESFSIQEQPEQYQAPAYAPTSIDHSQLRLNIYTGKISAALEEINNLIPSSSRLPGRNLMLLILKVVTHLRANQLNDARHTLIQALDQGRDIGAIRSIIDEGTLVLDQIHKLALEWLAQPTPLNIERLDYVDKLLNAAKYNASLSSEALPPLDTPLSDRELEILQLAGTGRINNQIAEQLFLSPNTIKWHLRRAYEKLGVNSRSQAIEQARKRQLI